VFLPAVHRLRLPLRSFKLATHLVPALLLRQWIAGKWGSDAAHELQNHSLLLLVIGLIKSSPVSPIATTLESERASAKFD